MTENVDKIEKIKAGDVVQLTHGGPHMTVEFTYIGRTPEVGTVWFDVNSQLKRASFTPGSLKKI